MTDKASVDALMDILKSLRTDAENEIKLSDNPLQINYWQGNADAFTVAINEARKCQHFAEHPTTPAQGEVELQLNQTGHEMEWLKAALDNRIMMDLSCDTPRRCVEVALAAMQPAPVVDEDLYVG